jgi:hypothetical protein
MLSIPNHRHRPQAIILFGYPEYEVEPKELKPLDNVVFFNKFGNKVQRPHLVYYDWATEWKQQAKKLKAHVAHVKHQRAAKEHGSEMPADVTAPVKERIPSPEQMKKRLRDMIDGLKKEQYRKK